MSRKSANIFYSLLVVFVFAGCASSRFGSAKKHEKVLMAAHINHNVINYASIKNQGVPMDLAARGKSRGILEAYTGGLVSLGLTAVKSVIANSRKKYTDTWHQGINDLYFYDQPSSQGPFDPVGMQFSGFSIERTFMGGPDKRDSLIALSADFELDTSNYNEIINDAVFRLKLKDLRINYSKAKVPFGKDFINADFNIVFTTSYVGQDGQLYRDVELGHFTYSVRHAPLDSNSAHYKEYYKRLANTMVAGKSFIVPRSFGYYKENSNVVTPYYNQGSFSIEVTVKESSKDTFVNELILNSSTILVDYARGAVSQKLTPAKKK